MFELPIIRFDDQKWLEELQKGQFYMRPSMYYQLIEDDGYVRNDPYDGSIPFPDNDKILKSISGKETVRERLLLSDRFIKCFYHCTEEDIIYGSNLLKITFSKTAIQVIKSFEKDSALVIFNPTVLRDQIAKSTEELTWCGDVQYLDEDGYRNALNSMLSNPSVSYKIPFFKPSKYSAQKEYRICVKHPFGIIDEGASCLDLSKDYIEGLSYTIDIGPIKSSCIISVNNLIRNGILYDIEKDHYYLAEEPE